MRKYRAYNKKLKKMMQVLSIELHSELGGVEVWGKDHIDYLTGEHEADRDFWAWDDCEVMECTGLTDKNGKEIFEGDIVTLPGKPVGDVRWNTSGVEFYVYGTQGADYTLHGDWEIIGNIYEHPELLKREVTP